MVFYVRRLQWSARLSKFLDVVKTFAMKANSFVFFLGVSVLILSSGCSSYSTKTPATLTVSPQPAYVSSGQTLQLTASLYNSTSAIAWSVTGAAGGTVDANGLYTAPAVTQNTTVTVTATSSTDPTVTASTTVNIIAPAVVSTTANPQVAQYTISVPAGLSVLVQFSTDTSYNFSTWAPAQTTKAVTTLHQCP